MEIILQYIISREIINKEINYKIANTDACQEESQPGSGDGELGEVGRCLLNRPEMVQRSVERTFRERDGRWHDLEAGVSLACPGRKGTWPGCYGLGRGMGMRSEKWAEQGA